MWKWYRENSSETDTEWNRMTHKKSLHAYEHRATNAEFIIYGSQHFWRLTFSEGCFFLTIGKKRSKFKCLSVYLQRLFKVTTNFLCIFLLLIFVWQYSLFHFNIAIFQNFCSYYISIFGHFLWLSSVSKRNNARYATAFQTVWEQAVVYRSYMNNRIKKG